MPRYLLLIGLLLATLAPSVASGQETQKELRGRIAAMDRTDPAVGYAMSVRNEGFALIGGGGAAFGVTAIAAIIDITQADVSFGNYIAGFGVPVGLSLLLTGLPPMLSAQKWLRFYVDAPPPPTEMARLKLIRTWRLELLRLRRGTGLLSSGFLGGATILSAALWGHRDNNGSNGTVGGSFADYDSTNAFLTLMFAAAGGAAAISGLLAHIELDAEERTPHRLYAQPQVAFSIAPTVVPQADGSRAVGVAGGLSFRF
jgi:hypothetical protein